MRIALFTETFLPKIDGVVTRLTHTIEHLRQAGHVVVIIAPGGGPASYAGAQVLGAPALPLPLYT
ncbi:MAG: glycosyltransferase family 1 protein, partial [Chloroflexota bacterium]